MLVDAFAELLGPLPDAHLLLVGDGECRAEVEAHVRQRRLAERVHFTGNRPDVPDFIAAFDVSVLSSDFEGTPLFVFESMAQGKPVVATAVGGLLEVIEDGRSGVLVPAPGPAGPGARPGGLAARPGAQGGDRRGGPGAPARTSRSNAPRSGSPPSTRSCCVERRARALLPRAERGLAGRALHDAGPLRRPARGCSSGAGTAA